jgi:hypothetical protein
MKRISRRAFAQVAGATVVCASAAWGAVARAMPESPQNPPQEPAATGEKLRYGMTKEQAERVQQAVVRRERQAASLRERQLPYGLEPAFVFRAKKHSKA